LAGGSEIGRQVGGQGDTADNNSALGGDPFGDFDGHDTAQGEADEDEGFGCIDLVDKPGGVVAEGFILLRWDPMDMGCLVAFGRADVGEHAVVGADAGDEICCHSFDFLTDGPGCLNLHKNGAGFMGIRGSGFRRM